MSLLGARARHFPDLEPETSTLTTARPLPLNRELEVGEVAPALSARLDATVDGEVSHLRLADYLAAGKWVVLFFYPKGTFLVSSRFRIRSF